MSRPAFLLLCLAAPVTAFADPLHTLTRIVSCSDLHRTDARHCFIVSPEQHWELISHVGGLLLLRRSPPAPGEPPLFFRPADVAPVAPQPADVVQAPISDAPVHVPAGRSGLQWLLSTSLLLVTGVACSVLGRSAAVTWRRRRRRASAIGIADAEITIQQRRLQVKRFQLVSADDYGTTDLRKWQQEKRYFRTTRLEPLLAAAGLGDQWPVISEDIDLRIEAAAQRTGEALPAQRFMSDPQRFDPRMDPIDYERHCAMLLWMSGWDAQVTAASGDQGADVLARRDGKLLVLQCKLYRSAVGNAAVQQISAARLHQQANYAAVVSNARYTPQARQLARTNGVYLLHHEELRGFQPDAAASDTMRSVTS